MLLIYPSNAGKTNVWSRSTACALGGCREPRLPLLVASLLRLVALALAASDLLGKILHTLAGIHHLVVLSRVTAGSALRGVRGGVIVGKLLSYFLGKILLFVVILLRTKDAANGGRVGPDGEFPNGSIAKGRLGQLIGLAN